MNARTKNEKAMGVPVLRTFMELLNLKRFTAEWLGGGVIAFFQLQIA